MQLIKFDEFCICAIYSGHTTHKVCFAEDVVVAADMVPPSRGGVNHVGRLQILLIEDEAIAVIDDRVKILRIARQEV
jgi:hypothetical protein